MTNHSEARVRKFAILAMCALIAAGCSSRLPLERAPLPFRQAEDSFKLGHYERAAHGYRIFIDSNDTPELMPRAYFKLAQSEFRLGNHDKCLATLDELQRRYPNEEWRQVYELRGDAEYSRGNPVSAVLNWEQALSAAESSRRPSIRRRISDAVDRMDDETLRRTRSVVSEQPTRDLIDAALLARYSGSSPAPAPTRAAVKRPDSAPTPGTGSAPLAPGQARVAVLLPLSGKYSSYGQRSLTGIELAFAGSGVDLVLRDSEGAAQIARAAIDELAQDPTVIAVIGPLRSKVAQAITPRAERARLPLLSLAQRKSIEGRYAMQTAMTQEAQAAQLAEYATASGLRRFGILFPRDPYGSALADSFQSELGARGGTTVGSLAYEPGTQEFAVEAVTVQRWVDADAVQAVFIPDFLPTAAVLAQTLRESRPGIALFGGNGWHDPGQLGAAAEALDGAVFVDGFFMGSQRPATQRFIAAYRAEHGETPRILEAQAYDAALLTRRALDEPTASSRDGFVSALRAMDVFEGAGGDIEFGADGVERQLFLLQLDGQRIREVRGGGSAAASSFAPSREVAPALP